MNLNITPIGVNGAFTLKGFNTNFLLETSKEALLLDCGFTAGRALDAIGKKIEQVEQVYISHLHFDHSGGLPELAFKRQEAGLGKAKIYLHQSLAQTIWPNQLASCLSAGENLSVEDYFDIISVPENPSNICTPGGLKLEAVRVQHMGQMNCFGLVVNEKIYFSTDSIADQNQLLDLTNRFPIETIFHDCSFKGGLEQVHASSQQLLALPELIRNKILACHYEEDLGDEKKYPDQANLKLAQQGRTYCYEI